MTAARDVLADLLLEDGRRWIDAAVDFQLEDALAVLEGEEPYNFLTRARGSSKTTDLAAVALALLLTTEGGRSLIWCAADADQGALAIDSIAGFASRTPTIGSQLEIQARRVVATSTGARLEILPADAASAWGIRPAVVFVDELANHGNSPAPKRLWEAVSSAVAKHDDARLVVLTTAGDPAHFAAKVLEHAHESPLWRVNEIAGPSPWADPDRLAEQKARLPQSVYEQLFENRWVAAEGSFLDPAMLDGAFTLEGPATDRREGRSYFGGLDLGHVNDRSVFALGHREGNEVHLDRLQVWRGSRARPVDFGEVGRYVVAAHERFRFRLRADPWQALHLLAELREKGVRTEEFTFSAASKQRLASVLLEGVNTGTLKLYPAEGLREELLDLRVKQTSAGGWTFDHRAGGHDDRAVAIALAAVGVIDQPKMSWRPIYSEADQEGLRERGMHLVDGLPKPLPPEEAERERRAAAKRKQDDDLNSPSRWFWL